MDLEEHKRLNQMWKDKVCYICGRKYPEILLNIEGYIHHGEKPRCLDLKSCRRANRKK